MKPAAGTGMSSRLPAALLLGSTLLAAACAAPPGDEVSAQASDQTASRGAPIELETVAPAEWARCWIEATGGAAGAQSILCSSSALASAPFVLDRVTMDIGVAGASLATKILVSSGRASSAPQGRAVLPTQFPVTLTLTVSPNYGKTNMGVGPDNDDLTATVTLNSAGAATKEHPVVFMQPFALWPIAIVEQPRSSDDLFAYVPAGYDVPSAPFTTGGSDPKLLRIHGDTEVIPLANRQHVIRASLVAPATGAIKVGVTLNLRAGGLADLQQSAVIDGPGIYIADPRGLRKATAADVLPAELLQDGAPATTQAPAPVGGPCDESRRPAQDPDATPCGASGQRCCNPIPSCANSGKCAGDDGECIGTTCL